MARKSSGISLSGIDLDSSLDVPLYSQLYKGISEMILSGLLKIGDQIPSSREISEELNLSRSTVTHTLELLLSEGFIESHTRSGTYVSREIAAEIEAFRKNRLVKARRHVTPEIDISQRGKIVTSTEMNKAQSRGHILNVFLPEIREFPHEIWGKIHRKHLKTMTASSVSYPDDSGYKPLRDNIAKYLNTARGIPCSAEQILITSGSQQSFSLINFMLTDIGDKVWIEEPGPRIISGSAKAHGNVIVPIPVDAFGLNPELAADQNARLAYVTSSVQHPMTVRMSLERRMQLLNWANKNNAWIIEDDYASEFRYNEKPIAPLASLDNLNRVVYAGSFGKSLLPSLRIGFLVLPPHLVPALQQAMNVLFRSVSVLTQQVISDFMEEGHFTRHIRKMRSLYARRQYYLVRKVKAELGDFVDTEYSSGGFHIVILFKNSNSNEKLIFEACNSRDIAIEQLNYYYHSNRDKAQKGLVLGFASSTEKEIDYGVSVLKNAFIEHTTMPS